MLRNLAPILAMLITGTAMAQGPRMLVTHQHGQSTLNIAIADDQVLIELLSPGFDIVGFEYTPETDAEAAAIDAALTVLADPLPLFQLPDAAACTLDDATTTLIQSTPTGAADGLGRARAAIHSEFRATYRLSCADISAIDGMNVGFFDAFARAQSLIVVAVTSSGAQRYAVTRDDPTLNLTGAF